MGRWPTSLVSDVTSNNVTSSDVTSLLLQVTSTWLMPLKCMFICLQDELETEKSSLSKQVIKLEDKIVSSSFEKMCICSEVMIFVICLQEQLETENSILSKQIGELFLVLYILIRHKNAYKKV